MTTQTQTLTKPKWEDVYITAELENEQFANMRVVTAKSEYFSVLSETAVGLLTMTRTNPITTKDICDKVREMMAQDDFKVYETVRVDENGIYVCLDVNEVDEEAIWLALNKVYDAIELNLFVEGEIANSTPLSYTWEDMLNTFPQLSDDLQLGR